MPIEKIGVNPVTNQTMDADAFAGLMLKVGLICLATAVNPALGLIVLAACTETGKTGSDLQKTNTTADGGATRYVSTPDGSVACGPDNCQQTADAGSGQTVTTTLLSYKDKLLRAQVIGEGSTVTDVNPVCEQVDAGADEACLKYVNIMTGPDDAPLDCGDKVKYHLVFTTNGANVVDTCGRKMGDLYPATSLANFIDISPSGPNSCSQVTSNPDNLFSCAPATTGRPPLVPTALFMKWQGDAGLVEVDASREYDETNAIGDQRDAVSNPLVLELPREAYCNSGGRVNLRIEPSFLANFNNVMSFAGDDWRQIVRVSLYEVRISQ